MLLSAFLLAATAATSANAAVASVKPKSTDAVSGWRNDNSCSKSFAFNSILVPISSKANCYNVPFYSNFAKIIWPAGFEWATVYDGVSDCGQTGSNYTYSRTASTDCFVVGQTGSEQSGSVLLSKSKPDKIHTRVATTKSTAAVTGSPTDSFNREAYLSVLAAETAAA